jgi:hypothetical protein
VLEIACDESGYEGERLIGTTTRLFAHASVRIDDPVSVLAELRDRIRSPATQYKANHLLREKHRATLRWFLGPAGPVFGHGHVFLLDKHAFVRAALRSTLGLTVPDDQLALANDVLRGRSSGLPGADRFHDWLAADPVSRSVLDPLVPAIVAAVGFWGPCAIAHDRQTQLPPRRISLIQDQCPLLGLRFVDAESHPEIQIADILAGTVRHLTESGDPELAPLLPPYVLPWR